MTSNGPDPKSHKASGLWARLFSVEGEGNEPEAAAEPVSEAATEPAAPPVARRVEPPRDEKAEELAAEPADSIFGAEEVSDSIFPSMGLDEPASPLGPEIADVITPAPVDIIAAEAPMPNVEAVLAEPPLAVPEVPPAEVLEPVAEVPAAPAAQNCPACGSEQPSGAGYCADCGWMFSSKPGAAAASPAAAAGPAASAGPAGGPPPTGALQGRYQILEKLGERAGISRFRGVDLHDPSDQPRSVLIVAGAVPQAEPELVEAEAVADNEGFDEFLPTFDDPVPAAMVAGPTNWPSVGWEKQLLEQAQHPTLPRVLDHFVEGDTEYLIEELPEGVSFWDAWDDPESTASMRYGWLIQLAEGLDALHKASAMLEGIRPDLIVVKPEGQAVIWDLTDLLPIPVPPNPPIRGSLYTAPELMLTPQTADARADLYSFGALLYSLEYLHHGLEEKDFERQFYPKMITDRYPDVHPAFNRLIIKTFVRDLNLRFPTEEASKKDPTGISELIYTLKVCQRTFERVRLDIAAWTTTGMVRSNNEDAFAFLHAVESRQDELTEYGLVLLCDGMGGYEAGEVAAAMTIQSLRTYLLQQPLFAALAGKEPPEDGTFKVEDCRNVLKAALKHANKEVHTASRIPGKGKRGMGCTAEAIYIDDQYLVVGHVGDSRTYHLTNGELKQLTRDQTLVNRLVELGMLTEEEAETHDRKNELQQAIGGQPDVEPGLYHSRLHRGDWVLVCSDGITNHIPTKDLEQMMLREAAGSAEEAARRLLNLVNLRGASDNATIVVIRVS